MRHIMIRLSFGAIALCCIAFFIIGTTPADAKDGGFHNRGLCSRVGTWQGEGDQGYTWIAVDIPGRNATNGEITLEWVYIDPTLDGFFLDAVRVTNALGVWKKVNQHMYQITWIAYGLDQGGEVVYTARASGETELVDCDHVDITYVLELWLGEADIYTEQPIFTSPPGTAWETRMPLAQACCTE